MTYQDEENFKKVGVLQYLNLLDKIIYQGKFKQDRTGTGTLSLFGEQMRFDLKAGFPLLTTKKIHFKSVLFELLWFIKGDTNINYLNDNGCSIWDEWADQHGNLGPIYGKQWRNWTGIDGNFDQLQNLVDTIKNNPNSRRMLVSAWNVNDLPNEHLTARQNVQNNKMALAACHTLFQAYVSDNRLSIQLYARSQDFFLGTPFNIASYALLTHLLAHICQLDVGELIWVGGDVHLYQNHIEQAKLQLTRQPKKLPEIEIKKTIASLDQIVAEDILLKNYQFHPAIKAPISI